MADRSRRRHTAARRHQPPNLLVGPEEKVWLIDWAQPVRGAAWIDVTDLIPHLILAGHTPAQAEQALAAVPAWTSTPAAVITSYAAAFAGYWARSSRLPRPPGVPSLRAYFLFWSQAHEQGFYYALSIAM